MSCGVKREDRKNDIIGLFFYLCSWLRGPETREQHEVVGMALSPRDGRIKKGSEVAPEPPKLPWVSWIAIVLGVAMTLIGSILLLWGLSWQTSVGEPVDLQGEELRGGACLIPMGGTMALLGVMWVLTGWKGFKRTKVSEDTRPCPFCGKIIESDLTFCYYCNRSFEEEEEEARASRENEDREGRKKGENRARPFEPR